MNKLTLLFLLVAVATYSQTKRVIYGTFVDLPSKDIEVKTGQVALVDVSDTTVSFSFKVPKGTKTLQVSIPGTTPPDPTVPTLIIPTTPISGGFGGTQSFPNTKLSGQTKFTVNYALAPGVPAAIIVVKFAGVEIGRSSPPFTSSWGDYKDYSFPIAAKLGTGTLEVTLNRGFNSKTYTLSK